MIAAAVKASLGAGLCGVLCATPCPAQSSTRAALAARLDSTADAMLRDLSLSSAGVAVVHGRDTLLLRGYGLADRESKRPATANTVYEIASVTKQVTAAAIMRLVERGKVRLDDDIGRYVPQFPLQGHHVTVRNLLNHTSGIHNFTNPPTRRADWAYDVPPDSMIALVADDTFDFAPGTRDAYSNTGYTLLGMIIEKASGQTYATFLQHEFFAPLGMRQTSYCASHPTDSSVARGYTKRNGDYVRAADNNMSIPFAAGGICSSVADFLVWERALHEGQLLQPASYKEMTTPGRLLDGKALSYGFGLAVGTLAGRPALAHSGSITGFTSAQVYLPADSVSVIVFTNTSSVRDPGPEPLTMDLARIVLGVPTNGFGALDRPGRPVQRLSVPGERAVGRKDAPIKIEVFSDFQCAGCADFHLQTLARVREEYAATGKVYWIHHEYPVPIPSHLYSREAARWALAAAALGKYEAVADALFRDQASWGKSGNIEATVSRVLTGEELARVKQVRLDGAEQIDAALVQDIALGHSFPVHGTPSFRIFVGGNEVFADHDEPEKLTPTTPRLKSYANLKRYLDELLAK